MILNVQAVLGQQSFGKFPIKFRGIMIDDNLKWVLTWYYNQFHDNWKLAGSIAIQTFDNPGWDLKLCLKQTELQDQSFQEITIDRAEHDWVRCYVEDRTFNGIGGPFNLPEIFGIFRNWTENYQKGKEFTYLRDFELFQLQNRIQSFLGKRTDISDFIWLIKWFYDECNGFWEHCNMITIDAIDSGWYISIEVNETNLEYLEFKKININRSESDWINCFIQNNEFNGICGPFNLIEVFQIFRNWAEGNQVENL